MGLFRRKQPQPDSVAHPPEEPSAEANPATEPGTSPPDAAPPHPPGSAPGPRGEAGNPRNAWNEVILALATFGFSFLKLSHRLRQEAIRHGGFAGNPRTLYAAGGAAFFAGAVLLLSGAGLAVAAAYGALSVPGGATAAWALVSTGAAAYIGFLGCASALAYRAGHDAWIMHQWAGTAKATPAWLPSALGAFPLAGPPAAAWFLLESFNRYWEQAPQAMRRYEVNLRRRAELEAVPAFASDGEGPGEAKARRRGTVVKGVGVGPGASSDPRNPIFRKRLVCPVCKVLTYVEPERGRLTHVTCQGCGNSTDLELRLQIETRSA